MYVQTEARGKGIGTLLVQRLLSLAAHGLRRFYCILAFDYVDSTQPHLFTADPFLQKMNFTPVYTFVNFSRELITRWYGLTLVENNF